MAAPLIPPGYHSVTPYLIVNGVADLIEFAKLVFGAKETRRSLGSSGQIQHARIRIGDSHIMMGEPESGSRSMPAVLYVYVEDVDRTFERALEAGATALREPADQFYGDRNAGVRDHCGNEWWIARHVEDIDPDELSRRTVKFR